MTAPISKRFVTTPQNNDRIDVECTTCKQGINTTQGGLGFYLVQAFTEQHDCPTPPEEPTP